MNSGKFAAESCQNERRGRKTSASFRPSYCQFHLGEAEEQTKMTEKTANSISEPRQQKQPNTAEFLYQGATVVAALLLVLSAAV